MKDLDSFEVFFIIVQEISHSDISEVSTKAVCKAALMSERHVRIEISDFVMRTFVLMQEISLVIFPKYRQKQFAVCRLRRGKTREEITALVLGVFYKVFS